MESLPDIIHYKELFLQTQNEEHYEQGQTKMISPPNNKNEWSIIIIKINININEANNYYY